jgi:hypothetical protein
MEPSITGHEAISRHDMLVHNWRVWAFPCRLPRFMPNASTGIRSPGWCRVAARRASPCASSAYPMRNQN